MPISASPTLMNQALAGNAKAQLQLAETYMQSENEEDQILAEEWALKSAQNGYVEAMYWLGEGYTDYAKSLIDEDPEEAQTYFEYAYDWLTQASEQNHAAAILELAGYYRRGNVVEKDLKKSVQLVEKSAHLGDVQAMRDLACIYEYGLGVDINEEQAQFWHNQAQKNEKKPI